MPDSCRQSYHTNLKYLAREGLLPADTYKQIPRSNLYRWRHESPYKYITLGIACSAEQEYEMVRNFVQSKQARRILAAYVRIVKLLIDLTHSMTSFHSQVKAYSKQVVDVIMRVKGIIGMKRALRFFNISVHTFHNWSAQSLTQCFESLTNTCNLVFHNQLSRPEVLKIKEMLTDGQFQYWPVSSVALYALREDILALSLNTWYKYANKLELTRTRPSSRRKKHAVSVRAERPHEIWHADVTAFVTGDRVKHYLYVVIDNFSRKILSWLIADAVSVQLRSATLEEALKNVSPSYPEIQLITDGGPENRLQAFLNTLAWHVSHKVALVDVHYSNSLIEAVFKTSKYNYLYRMDIPDENALRRSFAFTVDDFNNRPHISLKGLTPNEAEQNIVLNKEELLLNIKRAAAERRKYNQAHRCTQCKP